MRRRCRWAIAAAFVLLASALALPVSSDDAGAAPGSIRFEGRNAIATADGTFHEWRFARVRVDRDDPAASFVEVEIDVASLETGIRRRDDHLRSEDFFDVARYPLARVRVHDAVADGNDADGAPRYRAKFDVKIRDVERTLDGSFVVVSQSPPEVRGELELDRVEFGVGSPPSRWNPMSVRASVPVRFSARLPID